MITLTVKEIHDLAIFAGIMPMNPAEPLDEEEGEITICVGECPEKGLLDESDGVVRKYHFIAWFDDLPDEGAFGLGNELEANPEASDR